MNCPVVGLLKKVLSKKVQEQKMDVANVSILSEESVHRVYGSTVVDIFIPPPSFKPVS